MFLVGQCFNLMHFLYNLSHTSIFCTRGRAEGSNDTGGAQISQEVERLINTLLSVNSPNAFVLLYCRSDTIAQHHAARDARYVSAPMNNKKDQCVFLK